MRRAMNGVRPLSELQWHDGWVRREYRVQVPAASTVYSFRT